MPLDYVRVFAGTLLWILQIGIFIRVLLSWFPIDPSNPIIRVLNEVTEPVLAPFRRVIPRIGMFDLSPLAALLVISVLQVVTQVQDPSIAFVPKLVAFVVLLGLLAPWMLHRLVAYGTAMFARIAA